MFRKWSSERQGSTGPKNEAAISLHQKGKEKPHLRDTYGGRLANLLAEGQGAHQPERKKGG